MIETKAFREKIAVFKIRHTSDDVGNPVRQLVPVTEVRAYVNYATKQEKFDNGNNATKIDLAMYIRYSKQAAEIMNKRQDYIVQHRGINYRIISADDYQYRHETIKMSVIADVSGGFNDAADN